MSKIIISPIPRWQGTVTIADPLTLIQAQAIEQAMVKPEIAEDEKWVLTLVDKHKHPAIIACVESWNLENFSLTKDGQPPASPRLDSHKLRDWIFGELANVYFGEEIIPNESRPTPIDLQTPVTTQER